jgi:endo-1,4-beta-mannosidase
MGFIKFSENGYLQAPDGQPLYIVGINYVASYICTNFWEDWKPQLIEADMRKISEMGLNAVRIPMHWGFMEPEPGKYSELFIERFNEFLAIAKKYSLFIMPWFLVGIATKGYDFPFRNGRSFFSPEMIEIEENHFRAFIGRYKVEESILFWDICDEPEYFSYCGPGPDILPYDRKVMAKWVKTLYDAIKSVDKNHLVTLGYGQIATQNFGIHIRDAAEVLDLMVVTAYPGPTTEAIDKYRNNYFVPFNVKFNNLGKPVFNCESPGSTSVLFSEEVIGRYFRTSLYGNLLNGSTGVMPWVFNDFNRDIWHEAPLDEATFEPSFGIVDTSGRVKPSGKELSDFAQFVQKCKVTDYSFSKSDVAVLVTKKYYEEIDFTYKKTYTTFILAKSVFNDVNFVWDDQPFDDYKLLLIPTSRGITTSLWNRIRLFVEQGGCIYAIYDDRRGLNAYFNELFGVETVAGEKDYGYDSMKAVADWGSFKSGDCLELPGKKYSEALKVDAREAKVIMEFDDGFPALLVNDYGKGKAVLAAKPLEDGLLDIRNDYFVNNRLFSIYESLVDLSGIDRKFSCPTTQVEVGYLEKSETGEYLVICINHDIKPLNTVLEIKASCLTGHKIVDAMSGKQLEVKQSDGAVLCVNMIMDMAGICSFKIVK